MRTVARWFMHVVPLGVLALVGAGCGGSSDDEAEEVASTASSVTMAGPPAFVAAARAITFGNKDLAAASDRELLRLGMVVCDGLGIEDLGYRRVVQRLVRSEARPTTAEATAFVRSAVRNLCPAHASAIPS